ncbi:MAG: ABC transporter ATP-binding protein [Chloroflexota bacterium]
MAPDVLLEALTRRYGSVAAVDAIDLRVERGTYCCLLGPSGCGKTTTLRMIAGHEYATAGRIHIRSQDVTHVSAAQRPTSMMFQDYALFPHMNLIDNVAFGLKMRRVGQKERRQRAEAMLDTVGMGGEGMAKLPAQLSGGQRQRVALARSLITEPTVLLLDEPLSALDRLLRLRMRSELRTLQKRLGVTFVHVTHSQDEALALADLVVVMDRGRIQQAGHPRDVYDAAASQFVASFIGDHNILQGVVHERTSEYVLVTGPGGAVFHVPADGSAGETVSFSIRADHVRLASGDLSHMNVLSGTAAAVEYTGLTVRIRLEADGVGDFWVYVPEDQFWSAPVALGQPIAVSWRTTDVRCLAPI